MSLERAFLPVTDFVTEGYIDPRESLRDEGSFGDHTGYYTLPEGLESAVTLEANGGLDCVPAPATMVHSNEDHRHRARLVRRLPDSRCLC